MFQHLTNRGFAKVLDFLFSLAFALVCTSASWWLIDYVASQIAGVKAASEGRRAALPIAERAKQLFGEDGAQAVAARLERPSQKKERPQRMLRPRAGKVSVPDAVSTSDSGGDHNATSSYGGDGDGSNDGSDGNNTRKQMSVRTRRKASLALRQSRSKAAAWVPPLLVTRA